MQTQIEYGLTGEDWEPTEATKYFAQVVQADENGPYAFGSTARQAVLNLMEKIGD